MERFWSKVAIGLPDECWTWRAGKVGEYGVFRLDGTSVRAHRVALQLKLGRSIRVGYLACHTCDNPPCCNPAHLYEGTRQDNANDAWRRHRFGDRRGDRNANARLTDSDAEQIRLLYSSGCYSQAEIGRQFGVGQFQISRIVRGVQRKSRFVED